MIRTAFARRPPQEPAERQAQRMARMAVMAAQVAAQAKPAVTMEGGTSAGTVGKFDYIRSPRLLRAVATIPCQHCGLVGQTQAAHSNESRHGKGRGIKASDQYVAALCVSCHSMLDQGPSLTRLERRVMWFLAHQRTVRELLCRELWPASVPVPDVEACPWEEA
jgi:hypothetical protein